MGPIFLTDAHTSATYGNELKILCASEMPYGTFTVATAGDQRRNGVEVHPDRILAEREVAERQPSTDTDEFCSSPGPYHNLRGAACDTGRESDRQHHVRAASPLPFGASKFLLQVGYYPRAMQDDPVTNCTAGCTIAIDHHNTAAWYRVIYAEFEQYSAKCRGPGEDSEPGAELTTGR